MVSLAKLHVQRVRVARRSALVLGIAAVILMAPVCPGTNSPPTPAPPGTRDKYQQPFASTSPWNMPVGSGAVYVPARIGAVERITVDDEYWIVTDASMPLRPLFTNGNFYGGRCEQARHEYDIPFPDNLVIPDVFANQTPNNVAAVLLPDGRTIRQMNPISRCVAGGPVTAGFMAETVDIYGDGLLGGHGGSHLSSIGGSLRVGELTGPDPIRHVLKVNLWGYRFLSRANGGYRWPATAADSTALLPPSDERSYNGSVPALRMGSLLAIPPSVDIDDLGLKTEPARKLAWTLQNYGAYVVDSTGWNAHAFDAVVGVREEFFQVFGTSMETARGDWYDDTMKLFAALHVVDNNAPDAVGGGGWPRQPLIPPIGN